MTFTKRFILADPLNWECVMDALENDQGLIRLVKLYEVREKGSISIVLGLDYADSEVQPSSSRRLTSQWEQYPFCWVPLD